MDRIWTTRGELYKSYPKEIKENMDEGMKRLMELQSELNIRESKAMEMKEEYFKIAHTFNEKFQKLSMNEKCDVLSGFNKILEEIESERSIYKGFIIKFKDEHKLKKFMTMLNCNNYEYEETEL